MEPVIRSLRETDSKEADTIFRLSFGTFLGLPDPMSFFGDTDYIRIRDLGRILHCHWAAEVMEIS